MRMIWKILVGFVVLVMLIYVVLLLAGRKQHVVTFGVSFNQNHATALGLNWQEVYTSMLEELKPQTVRIAAMWSDVEMEKGVFDFSRVDWMMDKAAEHDTKVVLVVGQKAPRWPECHIPEWNDYSVEDAKDHLLSYVSHTVKRYKNHPALEVWQVENEPFIPFAFGECEGYNEEAIFEEIELVRKIDKEHNVLVTDSGELGFWKKAGEVGDYFGTTLYRIVRTPGGNIFTYDWLPAGFYIFKAKIMGISQDRFWVAELQSEPWFTNSDPTNTPLDVQHETMNEKRMKKHIEYVRHMGVKRAYLWGVEWWYFMKEKHDDERYWNVAKEAISVEKQNTP